MHNRSKLTSKPIVRNRRRQCGLGLLLAWLMLAQVATILHSSGHAGTPQRASCTLCIAVDHLSAPPLVEYRHELADNRSLPHVGDGPGLMPADLVFPYEGRAPPQHT